MSEAPKRRPGRLAIGLTKRLDTVAAEINDPKSCLEHGKALLAIHEEAARKKGKQDIRLATAYNETGIGWIMAKEYDKSNRSLVEGDFSLTSQSEVS